MRILAVTDWNRGLGGAEAYICWLRDGLRAAGDEVRLLTSSAGSAGDGTAEYVAYGTEQVLAQTVLQVVNPFALNRIRFAIDQFRPQVVFINMFAHHLSPAIFYALKSSRTVLSVSDYKCVCPIGSKLLPSGSICNVEAGWICHQTGCVSLPHWIRDRPRYATLRSGVASVSKVLACSNWVRGQLELGGINSECVHLPVPGPGAQYRRLPSADPSFVFCGRLDIEKGVEHLLRAFVEVKAGYPRSRLKIIGHGPERNRLELLSQELGIGESTEFTGRLDMNAIERELSQAWSSVAPSLWAEPLGLVALEAIVRGVPVIASAVGGFAETVEDGVTGFLVPNGNTPLLAQSMMKIAQGQWFRNGSIAVEAVDRITARHDIGGHVARMRQIFAAVA